MLHNGALHYLKMQNINAQNYESHLNCVLHNHSLSHIIPCSQVGALHRVSAGEELHQPLEQWRLLVRRGRLHHGGDGEQGGGPHRGHWRLAVSPLTSYQQDFGYEELCLTGDLTFLLGMRMIRSSGAACWGRCATLLVPPVCPCASMLPGCPNCRQTHCLCLSYLSILAVPCDIPQRSRNELSLRHLISCTHISVLSWTLPFILL